MITTKAYDEIVNLFARGSSSAEILQFHPSEQSQSRARYLLSRVKSDQITAEESAELESLGQLKHMMQLIKARARSLRS